MKIIAPVLLFLSLVAIDVGLVATSSCGSSVDCTSPQNASNVKCVAEQAVVDCTTATAKAYVAQNSSSLSQFFTAGGVDWAAVEQALVNLVAPEAICVLEDVVEHYLAPAPTPTAIDAGPGSAMTQTIEPAAVRQKAAEVSAKHWPGKKTKR